MSATISTTLVTSMGKKKDNRSEHAAQPSTSHVPEDRPHEVEQPRYMVHCDLSPSGCCTVSCEGVMFEANRTIETMLGALCMQPLSRFVHPDGQDSYSQFLGQLFDAGAPSVCDIPMVQQDSVFFWARFRAVIQPGSDNAPVCLMLANDIHESKLTDDALQMSEERYRRIAESITDYLYSVRIENGTVVGTTHSAGCVTVTGHSAEEFAAEPYLWFTMVVPEDREHVTARVAEIMAGMEIAPGEHRIIRKDGQLRWVRDTAILLKDGAGNLIGYDGVVKDITEQKQMEETLYFLATVSAATGGEPFFNQLARYLAQSLGMDFVCIDRLEGDGLNARTLAVWCDGHFEDNLTYALADTPCGEVVGKTVCCFPASVCQFFPLDAVLLELRAESYVGVTLFDHTGRPIGLIAVIGRKPLANRALAEATMKMVAVRAAGELERLDGEMALRRERDFADGVIETAHAIVLVLDTEGCIIRFNRYLEELSGYMLAEAQGKDWFTVFLPERERNGARKVFNGAFGDSRASGYVNSIVTKDGGEVMVEWSDNLLRDEQENILGLLAIGHDLTERLKADAARDQLLQDLAKRTRELEFMLQGKRAILEGEGGDFSDTVRVIFDAAREITGARSGYVALLSEDGRNNEVLFLEAGDLHCSVDPSLPMPVRGLRGEAYTMGRPVFENDFMHSPWIAHMPAGHVGLNNVLFAPLIIAGTTVGVMGLANKPGDFTDDDLRMAEAFGQQAAIALLNSRNLTALRESAQRLRTLIDSMPDIVCLKDGEGRWLEANAFALRLFGLEGVAYHGKKDSELAPLAPFYRRVFLSSEEEADATVWKTGVISRYDEIIANQDGEPDVFDVIKAPAFFADGSRQGLIVVGRDITDRRRAEQEQEKLEAQLQQSQRMESVGRLAGGVAHDFNNMLGVILGNADIAMEEMDPAGMVYESLVEIKKAGKRSADLTRQLLAFARKQTMEPKVLDLNEVVAGMLKLLRRLIGEDIVLSWQPGTELWQVWLDPSQIDQILANLCVNARDAIVGVGEVVIGTMNFLVDEDFCQNHHDVTPGEYVQLFVRDSGCGMDKETVFKIFEPFFTTKEVGKGTGLGLSTVYGAVMQNHGCIDVQSEPGHGTTISILLPRHAVRVEQMRTAEVVAVIPRGRETILLVEDEQAVLDVAKRMLTGLGYTVLPANTPGAAIGYFLAQAEEIDLLITDVVMPGMNGQELAGRLRAMCPRLKCLFISGYTADIIAARGVLNEGIAFISKPFSQRALANKVREVLEDRVGKV